MQVSLRFNLVNVSFCRPKHCIFFHFHSKLPVASDLCQPLNTAFLKSGYQLEIYFKAFDFENIIVDMVYVLFTSTAISMADEKRGNPTQFPFINANIRCRHAGFL
ncbi:hypothetical protein OS493_022372 [Desmophyllum pertusum]|uniref:Uncharacterized protein n=1 Tax=Desmophyllum pertusum TaxID=174260 RepID=A0A9W9ZZQ0_9CNID|nr:hypothetical protein OS493_022372 [Desmophyllum pertusum]